MCRGRCCVVWARWYCTDHFSVCLYAHLHASTENRYYDPVHDLMRQWGLVKEDLVE